MRCTSQVPETNTLLRFIPINLTQVSALAIYCHKRWAMFNTIQTHIYIHFKCSCSRHSNMNVYIFITHPGPIPHSYDSYVTPRLPQTTQASPQFHFKHRAPHKEHPAPALRTMRTHYSCGCLCVCCAGCGLCFITCVCRVCTRACCGPW